MEPHDTHLVLYLLIGMVCGCVGQLLAFTLIEVWDSWVKWWVHDGWHRYQQHRTTQAQKPAPPVPAVPTTPGRRVHPSHGKYGRLDS